MAAGLPGSQETAATVEPDEQRIRHKLKMGSSTFATGAARFYGHVICLGADQDAPDPHAKKVNSRDEILVDVETT
jgi:hypothetical protein